MSSNDLPQDITTPSILNAGESATSTFENDSDADWFSANLEGGKTYLFEIELTDQFSALNGRLQVYDNQGTLVSDEYSSVGYSLGRGDLYSFTPETSGTFFVGAEPFGSDSIGNYEIRLSEPQTDVIPSDESTEESVALGEVRRFDLEYLGDRDVFSVGLDAGTEYLILVGSDAPNNATNLIGQQSGGAAQQVPFAVLLDQAGNVIDVDVSSSNFVESWIRFTPDTSGVYFVGAAVDSRFDNQLGPSDAFVFVDEAAAVDSIPGDTFFGPEDRASSQAISIGGQIESSLDYRGDSDWFAVDLTEGEEIIAFVSKFGLAAATSIEIDVYGPSSFGVRPVDALTEKNFDFELVRFTADQTATYYFDVNNPSGRGSRDQFGDYVFSVQEANFDPEAGETHTTAQTTVGSTYSGSIDAPGDADWIAVGLNGGVTYAISVNGAETFAFDLRSGSGGFVSGVTDRKTSPDGSLLYTPTADETVFVFVDLLDEQIGSYDVTVEEFIPPPDTPANVSTGSILAEGEILTDRFETPGDVDFHAVTLSADTPYTFGASPSEFASASFTLVDANGDDVSLLGSLGGFASFSTEFSVADSGLYFLKATANDHVTNYAIGLTETSEDAHGSSADTATPLVAGAKIGGEIDVPGDADFFSFTASAGSRIVIDTSSASNRTYQFVTAPDGSFVVRDTLATGTTPRIAFDAPEDGVYLLEVGLTQLDLITEPLAYEINLRETLPDAVPSDANTQVGLSGNSTLEGQIEVDGDVDAYLLPLNQSQLMRITVEGSGDTPLLDPRFELVDGSGFFVESDDNSGNGYNAVLEFFAEAADDYLLRVAGGIGDEGSYRVILEERPVPTLVSSVQSTRLINDPSDIAVFFDVGPDSEGWTEGERSAVELALDVIESAVAVSFRITEDETEADWILQTRSELGNGAFAAEFSLPNNGQQFGRFSRSANDWNTDGFGRGSESFDVLLHEFGHGLGLIHPHETDSGSTTLLGVGSDSDFGAFGLNQGAYTVMTYNGGLNGLGVSQSMMAIDIAALHNMYGPNTSTADGDNTYKLDPGSNSYEAIWDTGGADVLRFDGSADAVLDLRDATLEYEEGGGGFFSFVPGTVGGISIANGVTIESAVAGAGNDTLVGNDADNELIGNGGDDELTGDRGDDVLNGGDGLDTAVYSGSQSNYTLQIAPDGLDLTDRRDAGNGEDALIDIELLQFDTGGADDPEESVFDLREFTGLSRVSESDLESFVELYIAYFNRAPDAIGLNFWGTAFSQGTTLEEMATLFVPQPETVAAYPPGTSNDVFATAVYDNVLGRTPDIDGLSFWVDVLDSGAVSRDQFILEVLRGAKSAPKPSLGQDFIDQQIADQAFLETKVDIGIYFAVTKGMSNVDSASSVMSAFDGSDESLNDALSLADLAYGDAAAAETGEFLLPLVGVVSDPFLG